MEYAQHNTFAVTGGILPSNKQGDVTNYFWETLKNSHFESMFKYKLSYERTTHFMDWYQNAENQIVFQHAPAFEHDSVTFIFEGQMDCKILLDEIIINIMHGVERIKPDEIMSWDYKTNMNCIRQMLYNKLESGKWFIRIHKFTPNKLMYYSLQCKHLLYIQNMKFLVLIIQPLGHSVLGTFSICDFCVSYDTEYGKCDPSVLAVDLTSWCHAKKSGEATIFQRARPTGQNFKPWWEPCTPHMHEFWVCQTENEDRSALDLADCKHLIFDVGGQCPKNET